MICAGQLVLLGYWRVGGYVCMGM